MLSDIVAEDMYIGPVELYHLTVKGVFIDYKTTDTIKYFMASVVCHDNYDTNNLMAL